MKFSSSAIVTIVAGLAGLTGAPAAAGDPPEKPEAPAMLYQWTDDQGRTHFSDTAPATEAAEGTSRGMPELPRTGVRLSNGLPAPAGDDRAAAPGDGKKRPPKPDATCRRYHSDLRKIELYLGHTPNLLDEQKAADLRAQIDIECNGLALKRDLGNAQCRRHHSRLNRLRLFNAHSPNERDRRRIGDLEQLMREQC